MEHDELRKELLGALIGLAKTCGNNPKTENTDRTIIEGLVAVNTQSFGEEMLNKKLGNVRREKHIIAPNCSTCASPCGNTSDYDLSLLNEEEERCRALKEQILIDIQDAAIAFYRAMMLRGDVSEYTEIFYKVLEMVTYHFDVETLEQLIIEMSDVKQFINNLMK